jgi:hypothetical protein
MYDDDLADDVKIIGDILSGLYLELHIIEGLFVTLM